VVVTGDSVRLTGTVASWHEREAAERAASHATGAAIIENRIAPQPDESYAGGVADQLY
jgi:osmotically-inducible protein OsmY